MNTTATRVNTQPSELLSHSLVTRTANRFGVDPGKFISTLKATCFRVKDGEVSNEQMLALLVVAEQYKLNPFTREIFAFPDKQNGIVPVVSVDGWARIINENDELNGFEFVYAPKLDQIDDDAKPCPAWCEVHIFRRDREHPIVVREYLDEVYRPAFWVTPKTGGEKYKVKGPWQTHTKRFLRHKTMIQGSRLAFGFAGIYDQDEAERIIEGQTIEQEPAKILAAPVVPEALPVVTTGTNDVSAAKPDTNLISEQQAKILRKLCEQSVKEFGLGEVDLCKHFHMDKLEQLKLRDYMLAVDLLSRAPVSDAAQS